MALECEGKFKIEDLQQLQSIQNLLAGSDALDMGSHFEKNWILDDAEQSMRRKGILVRIRSLGGQGGILTIKRKSPPGAAFKNREETESAVDSADGLLAQFAEMGYGVTFIYEKFRQTWQWKNCTVMLDECPEIGCFLEIEGKPAAIRKAAKRLGLNPEKHIPAGYRKLWRKHLARLGQEPRHMLFTADGAPFCRLPAAGTLSAVG